MIIVQQQENKIDYLEVKIVSTSSLVHMGDVGCIQLDSAFDSPAESVVEGTFVPLIPQG
ncbi:spore gernimation protein GerPD [Jeotgalibacillus marinus]|uniref:Spore gernimation protein GerPD n=1 Tax=Jeotgalibacillus marinus TaxID=86667 RepID=A0ABV3Q2S2_9BACL